MLSFELNHVEIRTHLDLMTLQLDLQIISRKLTALQQQADYCLIHQDSNGLQTTMRVIEEWQFTYEEQIVLVTNLYSDWRK